MMRQLGEVIRLPSAHFLGVLVWHAILGGQRRAAVATLGQLHKDLVPFAIEAQMVRLRRQRGHKEKCHKK